METSLVGRKVPDFEIASTGNKTFKLSASLGSPLVLYFYPKDNTPGCTTEGRQFRDLHAQFAGLGCAVAVATTDTRAASPVEASTPLAMSAATTVPA